MYMGAAVLLDLNKVSSMGLFITIARLLYFRSINLSVDVSIEQLGEPTDIRRHNPNLGQTLMMTPHRKRLPT